MLEKTTLTRELSNRTQEFPSAPLQPHELDRWSWFGRVDEYRTVHTARLSSAGTLCRLCETRLPHRHREGNRLAFRPTIGVGAHALSAHPILEPQYGDIVGYVVTWPPQAERSSAGEPRQAEDPSDLKSVLGDLGNVIEEARIEQFPIPPQSLVDEAERLIRNMYSSYPSRFEVSADPDGAIAIDVRDGSGQWVLLLCEPDGDALVLTNLEIGERQRYPLKNEKLDSFLRDALGQLKSGTL